MIDKAKPRTMDLIGADSLGCETLNFVDRGAVKDIWVYTDDTGVRALKIKTTTGEIYDYGSKAL